jgi:hypothetical protein
MHARTYGNMYTCWVYLRYFGLAYIFSRVSNNQDKYTNNKGKKIHKSHAILVEKRVINHNVNSKNNIQNLRLSNFKSVFMSVVIGNLKLAISVSCSWCFQPRGFPNGVLRDEGHIATWSVRACLHGGRVTLAEGLVSFLVFFCFFSFFLV